MLFRSRDKVLQFDDLRDFADTAAIIATLDLVIAVDTANAHLTGAMGKPVWVLLSAVGEWRWGSRRDATAWYPTARLFRQATRGDWSAVIAQTRDAQQYIRAHGKPGSKPFLLWLAWGPPHNPYETAPEKYRAMYSADKIQLRPNVPPEMQKVARGWLAGRRSPIRSWEGWQVSGERSLR